jgi:hypothetical protein
MFKFIGKIHKAIFTKDEELFVSVLADLLFTYKKSFSFLKGAQGEIGATGEQGPPGPSGSGNRLPERLVTSRTAVTDDVNKLIILNAAATTKNYSISPVTMIGLIMEIYCEDNTQGANVIALSGTLKLRNLGDQTTLPMMSREPLRLISDGTNLIQLGS